MSHNFFYQFICKHKLAVLSTVSSDNAPESALVGIAITPDLKIIFDTVSDSRKYRNLMMNPKISFVIGWDAEETVQYEGIAKIPGEDDLQELLEIYFRVFPDGKGRKENWKNIAYFYVEPKWMRYSNFSSTTPQVEEFQF